MINKYLKFHISGILASLSTSSCDIHCRQKRQCLAYNCADSLNTILIIIRKICKNLFFKFISGIIGRASLSTSSCDIQNQHCRQKRQNTLSSESGQLHDRIVLETAPVALFPHQHATGMSM